jgi:hypothetical protein
VGLVGRVGKSFPYLTYQTHPTYDTHSTCESHSTYLTEAPPHDVTIPCSLFFPSSSCS